jgi:CHAT domain-containing protein
MRLGRMFFLLFFFFSIILSGISIDQNGLEKNVKESNKYFSDSDDSRYYYISERIENVFSNIIRYFLYLYDKTCNKIFIEKALYFSEIKNIYIYNLNFKKNKIDSFFNINKNEKKYFLINNKYLKNLLSLNFSKNKISFFENKLNSLNKEYLELMKLISDISITLRFKDFNTKLIQKRINPGQLIIKYTVLKEDVFAFYITNKSIGYIKLKVKYNQILEKIKDLAEPLDDFKSGNVDYLRINYNLNIANYLYKVLLRQVLKNCKNMEEIFIIPEKELFKLPFEALVTGFSDKDLDPEVIFSEYGSANYLIQKFTISYYFSLFDIQKRFKEKYRKKYIVTAFGNPVIEDRFREKSESMLINFKYFNKIPSSRKEILDIKRIFVGKECKTFLDKEFNKRNFESYAYESKIVHIATHFINNIDFPKYSALLFSSKDNNTPFYYTYEISKLKLNSALVILSACESLEKDILGLNGLNSISFSFKNSGVKSVIVSMWPVDEFSSKLVPLFYENYKRVGKFSLALRDAKLRLMKKNIKFKENIKISLSHPFIWSNYILYNFYF